MVNLNSGRRLEKQLQGKANFRTVLPLKCSKFALKHCERLHQTIKFEWVWG